jgi:hypothetical protein
MIDIDVVKNESDILYFVLDLVHPNIYHICMCMREKVRKNDSVSNQSSLRHHIH